ncbi:MAG: AMP-binding protein [Hyphomicrobiales bacterium]|nr:AMP-binding protein [Hyphomicrobiales bacterium]
MTHTISALLQGHNADAPALGAPNRTWLNYSGLRSLSSQVRSTLHAAGIGRGDRVAIVLPNGADMAAAFVTIAQTATTAPLNAAYRQEEFEFYLEDLKARAIVIGSDYDGPALAAANKFDLAVLRLATGDVTTAGTFTLMPEGTTGSADTTAPGDDDVALILHTSGTTARPKIVPLLQSNIYASAKNIGRSLELTSEDRCMNVMPLFHIHGLVAAVSASLAAGGSIWCTPGFNALQFFAQLTECDPTWYTAVPTMHQAILSRAGRNADIIGRARLRFVRSSSASLPPPVMIELEGTFGAPVIESYGMTEAAHQMCSNPLGQDAQKPGSVGVAAGPEVHIAHETENRLFVDGETGEVVISGTNVTPGYDRNPEANAKSFFEAKGRRWFRTGDQGAFDSDRYLRLTGRLKEIINRGGEKVSPLEVDAVLLDHGGIAQAVTFGLPHPKLGEEVAAAVVPVEGATLEERDVRDFAAERLADFKVPRRVVIVDELPKGNTGKLQRIGMAEKLGLTESA